MNVELLPPIARNLLAAAGITVITLLFVELAVLHFRRRRLRLREARMAGLSMLVVTPIRLTCETLVGGAAIAALAFGAAAVSPLSAPVGSLLGSAPGAATRSFGEVGWLAWIYGFVVYEFFYWAYHFLSHRVRLLWCAHSTHHAPESMHLLIGTNHSPIDAELHLVTIVGLGCGLLGVPPFIVLCINLVDRSWAGFLHLSDEIVRDGRFGLLAHFMQTPYHHRVHHARNDLYRDKNLAPMTQLWDRIMGTFQLPQRHEPVEFGITRRPDTGSLLDVQLGEYRSLWRDVRGARSWREAVAYALRPPGWKPMNAGLAAFLPQGISPRR